MENLKQNVFFRWSNLRAKVVLAKQRIAPKMQLRSEQISHVSQRKPIQSIPQWSDISPIQVIRKSSDILHLSLYFVIQSTQALLETELKNDILSAVSPF